MLGFGGSPLGNAFGNIDSGEAARCVHAAIDAGINFFDTSPYYGAGLSEERLGHALTSHRHQVILATKCGRYGLNNFDFSRKRIFRSVEESLHRLRTDYIDVFQAHDIEFVPLQPIVDEAIPAMRELQQMGKVRFVGITGLQLKALRYVVQHAPVDTVLSYCRFNLLNTQLESLMPLIDEQKIGLINASPLHMGLLSRNGGPAWHPAPDQVKQTAAREVAGLEQENIDAAQLALQFAVEDRRIATTLVGISSPTEVASNLLALESEYDATRIDQLRCQLQPVRDVIWKSGLGENCDDGAVAPSNTK